MRICAMPTLAAAALGFWALMSIADQPVPPPPTATAEPVSQDQPRPYRLPNPRTMTQFPGP